MNKKRLLWQLFPSYLLITLIALLIVTWYASSITRQYYIQQKAADLQERAHLIENQVVQGLLSSDFDSIDSICKSLGNRSETRITVILPDGEVIGDTEQDVSKMDNHLERPEITEALKGKIGVSIRFSSTVHKDMMYVALPEYHPEYDNGKLIGFLRISVPLTFVEDAVNSIRGKIGLASLFIALSAALISLLVSWRTSRPLEVMKRGVEKFAAGDLSFRLPLPYTEEMSRLAEALNHMAGQLNEKIRTIIQQRNEQQAVFESMSEGVIAVDKEERLISINKAAARLFDIETAQAPGRTIQEVIRNTELQQLILTVLEGHESIENEITLWSKGECFLQVNGRVLKDAQSETIGVLVVINDITRLRQLENYRRDFVANVSHELRTPLTSIKGYVETLLDGDLDDKPTTMRFLSIIARQAESLRAIVEDLLSLAKLEQEEDKSPVILEEELLLKNLLNAAIQVCLPKATEKNIKINLNCREDVKAKFNFQLLEEAVVNLIDNAIKYSDSEKEINVIAGKIDSEITITVQDQGRGIKVEHLPRIFERFYRVDKARSRKLGGTGLGLAIVKHIARAHHGSVTVESEIGKGSRFSIHLPDSRYSGD